MIMCSVDEITEAGVRGWAIDEAAPDQPVVMHVLVDGVELGEIRCDGLREDVGAAGFKSVHVGYAFPLPAPLIDGAPHELEFRHRHQRITVLHRGEIVEKTRFNVEYRLRVHSYVDGLTHGALRGWLVAARGEAAPLTGGRDILVTCNDERVGQVSASRYRGDVGRALSADPSCGFQFTPPAQFRTAHPKSFRFFLLPDMVELDNSPYVTSFVTDRREGDTLAIVEQIDQLHADLTRLRRQVRALLPDPGFTLADYDRWWKLYEPELRRRVLRGRDADDAAAPGSGELVSIVMPAWRPALREFEAAVQSALAQSWDNIELIIVDDASGDADLTALLGRIAESDGRVRVIRRTTNGGISRATNDAIAAATGRWVLFFDHDDLLVDVAVEHMLAEAAATGALLLYSDEDKIDAGGYLQEPAFKPDWNYRLLLGVNYVCHLTMVDRAILAQVSAEAGPLDPEFDGAQDHDLLLRLAEILPDRRIHHVPEILYHWRMSANSTAASIGNKSYAITAGRNAVAAHLARRNLPAEVQSRDDVTLYKVDWKFSASPKVTIIVPFKDEPDTTRSCLEALLGVTNYPEFDIILVDNWSMTRAGMEFSEAAAAHERVRVLRIKEAFNYARLNNLAVAETDAEFIVFLNNDVFVEGNDWLRILVDEALADPRIGVVGGKFLYPNRTVQHAGVILGIGDVAGHAHVGIPGHEGGYAGRASFAQEMSAVTAAGMLVRASVFRAVGGFDEVELAVAFNDIDLCLKIRERGFKVIWTPYFVAEHHESLSRGSDDRPAMERRFFHERETMIERYGALLRQDPFYSPHFALDRQAFFDLVVPGSNADRYGSPRHQSGEADTPAAPRIERVSALARAEVRWKRKQAASRRR